MTSKGNLRFRAWLTLRLGPIVSKPAVRELLAVLLLVAAVAYFAICILVLYKFVLVVNAFEADKNGDAIRNLGLVLVAIIGAAFVVWRSVIASAQAATAAEGLITDRYTKAVDQLGAVRRVPKMQLLVSQSNGSETLETWDEEQPNIEVRLGGIFALRRIAEDSERDHIAIMETLSAYVRVNSRLHIESLDRDPNQALGAASSEQRIDIDAALRILCSRTEARRELEVNERFAIDLTFANLSYADLMRAELTFADFGNAILSYARLDNADLTQSWMGDVNFDNAVMTGCNLAGVALRGADLKKAIDVSQAQLEEAHGVKCGYGETKLPPGRNAPEHWFEAEEREADSHVLRQAYFDHLHEFYESRSFRLFPLKPDNAP